MYSDVFWATTDGQQIVARLWNVDRPRGTVLITHGLGDHSGRWERVARHFNEHGFAVLSPDLRGHGRSDGQRGFVRDFEHFLDDLDISVQQAVRVGGDSPVWSFGHSFGGLLVLYHALRRQPRVAGIIATSPALEVAMKVPPWKVTLGKTLGRVWPRLSVRTSLDLNELSDDPQVESRARSDRYMHGRITPRTWFGLVDAGRFCQEHAGELAIPALLLHGENDAITDVSVAVRFAEKAKRCELKTWPNGKHELHNMSESQQVLDWIIGWMDKANASDATAPSSSSAQPGVAAERSAFQKP